jgi:hypothetical protein
VAEVDEGGGKKLKVNEGYHGGGSHDNDPVFGSSWYWQQVRPQIMSDVSPISHKIVVAYSLA